MFIWSGPYAGPISLWLWVIELWFLVENFRMNTDSVDNAVIQNPRFFLEGCIHTTLRFWPISRSFLGLNFKWLIKTQKSVVPPQKDFDEQFSCFIRAFIFLDMFNRKICKFSVRDPIRTRFRFADDSNVCKRWLHHPKRKWWAQIGCRVCKSWHIYVYI